jgi:ligand-binding sensor domain-containing protein
MKKRVALIIAILSTWLFSPFTTSAQDIHFETVPGYADEVLNSILSMSQDKNGFLWFGTAGAGLFKYDGFKYINYRVKSGDTNSISSDQIECIAADKDGYIWIGHYHGSSGLERFDPATGIFTHFHHHANDPNSLSSDTINAIMQDHEGSIWLATVQGLDKYDPKAKTFYHYHHIESDPGSLSSNQIRIIYEDKKGTIWVGTGNCWLSENPQKEGGLNKLNKITGKFTRYLHKENDSTSLVDDRVGAIFEDSHGNFWVGTAGDGLHTMDREHGTFIRHKYDSKNPSGLSRPPLQYYSQGVDDNIRFIIEDNKRRIWIGTYQGGINVYDPATKTVSYYGPGKNSKEKLEINFYWYVCKTKDDIIWISTLNSTFYKINPYQQNKLLHTHIVSSRVNHLIEDKDQGIWAATNNGLFHLDNKGKTQKFEFVKDSVSNSNMISFIEKDDNGKFGSVPFTDYIISIRL